MTHFWTSQFPYSLYRRCISRRRYVAKTWAIYHNAQTMLLLLRLPCILARLLDATVFLHFDVTQEKSCIPARQAHDATHAPTMSELTSLSSATPSSTPIPAAAAAAAVTPGPLPTRYRTLTFSAGFLCGQASLCVAAWSACYAFCRCECSRWIVWLCPSPLIYQ